MRVLSTILGVVLLASFSVTAMAGGKANTSYPEGYRHWTHVKSMVIQKGHSLYSSFGGIHHLYANPKAIVGYHKGEFPDGSVLVFDLYGAKESNNTLTAGSHKVVGVMRKDSDKYQETGGWGFEGFGKGNPNKPLLGNQATAKSKCFQCHTSQKDNDYVFSSWME